jgi:hypothetical protein
MNQINGRDQMIILPRPFYQLATAILWSRLDQWNGLAGCFKKKVPPKQD